MRVLVFLLLANAVTAQSGGGDRSLAEEEKEGSAAAEEEVSGEGELRMRNLDMVLEDFHNHEINLPRAEPLIQKIVYMMEDQELDSLSKSDLDKPDVQEVSEGGGAPVVEDGRKDNHGIGGGGYFISRPATNQSAPVVLTDIHEVNFNRFSLGFVAELSQCSLEI